MVGTTPPNNGCREEIEGSRAAYSHALQWIVTGDERHAKKAIEVMNAWSAVLTGHTDENSMLQAGWAAGPFCYAAEIIRYTYDGWEAEDIARFEKMLKKSYVPDIYPGKEFANGNWWLVGIQSLLAIAVFCEDEELFDFSLDLLRKRIPFWYYLKSDGALPKAPFDGWSQSRIRDLWSYHNTLVDGLAQETCRDMVHAQYGIGSMMQACEIAYKQGVDIYKEFEGRIVTGMEFNAGILNGERPSGVCDAYNDADFAHAWEIGYNHYHNRRGLDMPRTYKLLEKNRPERQIFNLQWGTLTHAELPQSTQMGCGLAGADSHQAGCGPTGAD